MSLSSDLSSGPRVADVSEARKGDCESGYSCITLARQHTLLYATKNFLVLAVEQNFQNRVESVVSVILHRTYFTYAYKNQREFA